MDLLPGWLATHTLLTIGYREHLLVGVSRDDGVYLPSVKAVTAFSKTN